MSPKSKKWNFPGYRFTTKVPLAEDVEKGAEVRVAREDGEAPQVLECDMKDLREFSLRCAERAEKAAQAVEYRYRKEEQFRAEVINFFSYLMDSVESVTGGQFPSKPQVISEMRNRYLKKRR